MALKPTKGKKRTAKTQQMAKVALYNLNAGTEKGDALRGILSDSGIIVRTIMPESLNDPVGAVAGLTGFRPSLVRYADDAPSDEFMLMCNLSSAKVDELLKAMKDADLQVDHKAGITKFNKNWPLINLMDEIRKEHEAAQAAKAAKEAKAAAETGTTPTA